MAKGSARRPKNFYPDAAPPVPLAVSPSPSLSDSSDAEDISNMSEMHPEGSYGVSASRPGSPMHLQFKAEPLETNDVVTCQWEDCGVVFTHLPTLIAHIHNDHIGVHKSNYTCEWSSCLRRGLPQTSRFALISHIRSHTVERSHSSVASLVKCDKSFTRSDALAKHMRLQHNISPPAPGRGGSRKRKRGEDQGTSTPVDPHTPSEHVDAVGNDSNHERNRTGTNGKQRRQTRTSQLQPQPTPSPDGQVDEEEDGYTSSASDILPVHLQEKLDESTGLIMGHTPTKILLEQLRATKLEMRKDKEEKERALDELLQRMLGPDAGILMPLPIPQELVGAPPAGPNAAVAPPTSTNYLSVPQVIQNGTSRT
ncbi:hypothetical protein M413DRAFT_442530 [Hebeloma cylindrosporum]|uniref:C2H2-type domain-containing protein n=1 Tax=Hebeloma cylindrosporum TaxID=76867 RepID=A0A0C2YU78_HEBCY|nr:hypothetical protein M413DRAFT_442530 [Hebeloma cylindrosporum h7]